MKVLSYLKNEYCNLKFKYLMNYDLPNKTQFMKRGWIYWIMINILGLIELICVLLYLYVNIFSNKK